MVMIAILAVLLLLCHLSNLICNVLRTRSVIEIIIPILGIIFSGLMFIPSIFVWMFSFSFVCFPIMMFLNIVRYGQKHLIESTKSSKLYQYIIYGVSGFGVLASLIGGTIWSCI